MILHVATMFGLGTVSLWYKKTVAIVTGITKEYLVNKSRYVKGKLKGLKLWTSRASLYKIVLSTFPSHVLS